MSEPRWSDADPRPLYRDEQGPSARRQSLPRERGRDPRGREPRGRDPRGPGPRSDGRPPAQADGRLHWGTLPGVLGVCIVIGGAALGALVSAVTSNPPGFLLGAFVVLATGCAVLAVRPTSVYRIIPVPALAYLVASLLTGLAVNQAGTTLTALAVGATQWVASGFAAMIIATMIAIVATIVRWPRSKGGPGRLPGPRRGRGPGGRDRPRSPRADDRPRGPRAPADQHRRWDDPPGRPRDGRPVAGLPRRPPEERPRWPQEPRIRRTQAREPDSLATAAFPDWYQREGRHG